jgi:hypothetical protein
VKRIAALCLSIAFVFVAGCGDDEPGPGQFQYPLELGNTWYYTRTWVTYNPDSSINSDYESRCVAAITDSFRLSGALTYRLDIYEGEGSTATYWGAEFYQQSSYGLLRVGACGFPPHAYPKRSAQEAILRMPPFPSLGIETFAGSGSDCDSLESFVHNPGRLTIPYPEKIGHSWSYADETDIPFAISRTIDGTGQATVPAGRFNVYQIGWYYSPDLGLSVIDEVASSGLIRRTMTIDSLALTDYEHPGGTVYGASVDIVVLDSLKLRRQLPPEPFSNFWRHP